MNQSKSDTPMRRVSTAGCERLSHASLHSKSSALSSCRICLSAIRRPATLDCGHRFCEKCLQQYWSEGEKPAFIVCPLCRANTSTVNFAKKEEESSVEDFQQVFTPTTQDIQPIESDHYSMMLLCLKISTIITGLYYMGNLLRAPLVELFMYLKTQLTNIM